MLTKVKLLAFGLDGVAVTTVPANLTGNHLVQIIMANAGSPAILSSPE
jgi:hypothetical protein